MLNIFLELQTPYTLENFMAAVQCAVTGLVPVLVPGILQVSHQGLRQLQAVLNIL